MDPTNQENDGFSRKRRDVGYKRPPVETQFKKGQKPPPRKKKIVQQISAKEILWKVLQERRRVVVDDKAVWLTNSELIARRAFLEAEKGSSVLQRLLNELLMGADPLPEDDIPEVRFVPKAETGGFATAVITIRDRPPDE